MWFWRLACSCLLMVGISSAVSSIIPPHMKFLVELFNRLIGVSIAFDYDFGPGVPLLKGEYTIYMNHSIQLLPHSNYEAVDGLNTFILRSPFGFWIMPKGSQSILKLKNCYMRLQYCVTNITIAPRSVWLYSCIVSYLNGTVPSNSDQVLPLLSQALYRTSIRYFSFEGGPNSMDIQEVRKVLKYLIYHAMD